MTHLHKLYNLMHQQRCLLLFINLLLMTSRCQGRSAFEKMTDIEYRGDTYYTIRNLSLYECQGWCREEPECQAASFGFAVNSLLKSSNKQETICLLQNGTQANNPTARPLRRPSHYYMVKMSIRSDKVCKRPWNFERVPNSMIQGRDKALIFTSTKEACLAACLNEQNFVCRSSEYNYITLQCRLSDFDRRTPISSSTLTEYVQLVEANGVDYFENLCLTDETACSNTRHYDKPRIATSERKMASHVQQYFYVDKELMATSSSFCRRSCQLEAEFLCRSYLYMGQPTGSDYNCKLYHMDHWTLPYGSSEFRNSESYLGENDRVGIYFENSCKLPLKKKPKSFEAGQTAPTSDKLLCRRVVSKDRRYATQISCFEPGSSQDNNGIDDVSSPTQRRKAFRLPIFSKQSSGGALASLFNILPKAASHTSNSGSPLTGATSLSAATSLTDGNVLFSGLSGNGNNIFGGSNRPQFNDGNNDNFLSSNNFASGNENKINFVGGSGSANAAPSTGGGDRIPIPQFENRPLLNNDQLVAGNTGSQLNQNSDINCDNLGTCYDVTVHCKDTRIVVNVVTNKLFSGRIYSLGRSETCNVDVINSDAFRLDLTMSGQDCNTQSVNGVYTNTVVVQRHNVVMTKTDKIYKVRCTYDTTSRNITFGMMPIRDPDMISITSAPEAPAPRISILDSRGKEVDTVRIGDRLTFRIAIPDKTPYGIFARSCIAMAKDSRSTFQIVDENGCPSDPTIFPSFTPSGNALSSNYEAFRFTESYGVIFQCNVKYCLGPCQPAKCIIGRDGFDSWGKRKRRSLSLLDRKAKSENSQIVEDNSDNHMSLSKEIIVLDFGDEDDEFTIDPQKKDKFQTNQKNKSDYHASPVDWQHHSFKTKEEVYSTFHALEDDNDSGTSFFDNSCPTRTTMLSLSVACALLLIIYVGTLAFFFYFKKNCPSKSKSSMLMAPDYLDRKVAYMR